MSKGRFSELQMPVCNRYWFSTELLLSWAIWYSIFWDYVHNAGEWFLWAISEYPARVRKTVNLSERHSHSAGLSGSPKAVSHVHCAPVLSLTCISMPLLPELGLRCPPQVKHSPITSTCGNPCHLSGFGSSTHFLRKTLWDSLGVFNFLLGHFSLHVCRWRERERKI